jgi:hypothetical protein
MNYGRIVLAGVAATVVFFTHGFLIDARVPREVALRAGWGAPLDP